MSLIRNVPRLMGAVNQSDEREARAAVKDIIKDVRNGAGDWVSDFVALGQQMNPDTTAQLGLVETVQTRCGERWTIRYCVDAHSRWWEAEDESGSRIQKANADDLVELVKQLNG